MIAVLRVIGGFLTGILGLIGIIWGIAALIMALLFFFPGLGWGNWLVIPFSVIGLLICVLAAANPDTRGLGKVGTVLCSFALGMGFLRLIIGAGVL